jgi:O-antigen/teichoic acid export membrane protein
VPSDATILAALMPSRLGWRRSSTAIGIYASTALSILGSLVAANVLGPSDFGLLALAIATTALFQLLLDLTSDEALVKYGFRYSERGDWGRLRRVLELSLALKLGGAILAGSAVVAFALVADDVFGTDGLARPLLLASLLPILQSIEGIAAAALVLRSRYDLRAWFLFFSMALRLLAIAVAAPHGVTATVGSLVAAQIATTLAIGAVGLAAFRRFPRARAEPLGPERRDVVRFVLQSSIGTGIVSLRTWIAPLLLGVVTSVRQVGLFRAAQAPQQGLAALSSPVRLILLAEQTRDWERGRVDAVYAGLRRYVAGAAAAMVVVVVPLWLLMPWLIELVLPDYTDATDAARIILLAGALQLVFGWTKSFPVSIGRPNLRILAHGIETIVLVPLILILGAEWGATGAAGAVLASTVAFATVWTALVLRLRKTVLSHVPAHGPPEVTTV